jgi:hypothetical protein
MSYAVAAVLQTAIYGLLSSAPDLTGVDILDAVPPGGGTGTFVLLGPEEVVDASDKSGGGAEHRFVISVISDLTGFLAAKTVAAAVSEALIGQTAAMATGRIVSILFQKAVAKRLEDGDARRIDLTFRARIEV